MPYAIRRTVVSIACRRDSPALTHPRNFTGVIEQMPGRAVQHCSASWETGGKNRKGQTFIEQLFITENIIRKEIHALSITYAPYDRNARRHTPRSHNTQQPYQQIVTPCSFR
jgi:hypothetical protein